MRLIKNTWLILSGGVGGENVTDGKHQKGMFGQQCQRKTPAQARSLISLSVFVPVFPSVFVSVFVSIFEFH